MNRYKHFQQGFAARHAGRVRPSVTAQIITFAATMFLVGLACGYFLAMKEAAHFVTAFTK